MEIPYPASAMRYQKIKLPSDIYRCAAEAAALGGYS
ncbi:hypothetical protein DJFAAGMI_00945 [Comamonas sp. PE63]|uniref:Uncharacterized protein n=1 Tax=Comamonas brasiliensis TaxID=1812482 RepID=A0ABS5LNZ7_9BURK|nr:hypothetical protein [Comamonas sp. PE63]